MVLGWSRATYVEFIRKADTSAFLHCHINAFEFFGGVPDTALYDNTKLVVLSRQDDGTPVGNERFLDFSLRVGFRAHLCQPYRCWISLPIRSGPCLRCGWSEQRRRSAH